MNKTSVLIWVGLLLSILGALTSFSWDAIFYCIIAKEVSITNTSRAFPIWKDTPMPLILKFYFFNWTNPEEIMEEDYIPNFVEVGPYVFEEYQKRVNITWHKNHTITFRRMRYWYFVREMSIGSLEDNVTTLNPVALSASYVSRFHTPLMLYSLATAIRLTGQRIWVTKKAGEFLYDGYSDPLLTIAYKLPHFSPTNLPGEKFGWFYGRNGSTDYEGVFNMETGEEDFSLVGLIRTWNDRNRTDYYKAECGQINGSEGTLFLPGQKKHKPVVMFSFEFCKTIKFDYLKENTVNGIPGYQYVGGKALLDSGTVDPENWCNCNGECVLPGVLNISACRFGAPAFVSYPHFLDAHPYYLERVNGLKPDPERHRFHMTIEPLTGIPLDVVARFQVNLLLQQNPITLYQDVPTIFFPMLWFEETAVIPPDYAAGLKKVLLIPVLGMYCSIGILLLGLLLLAITVLPKVFSRGLLNRNNRFKRKSIEKHSDTILSLQPLVNGKLTSIIAPEENNTIVKTVDDSVK